MRTAARSSKRNHPQHHSAQGDLTKIAGGARDLDLDLLAPRAARLAVYAHEDHRAIYHPHMHMYMYML